ncbi:MAG: MmcQ/YjbR family DNA-binding protein [Gemmatimonadetes bacterium]|nr:MmcQ/YjbR family DNA-binding protein [Gemmatimonadota bacterium]
MSKDSNGPTAPAAIAAIERLRETVAGLPEVVEKIDKFGHVAFRVRDKPFVLIGNGKGDGSLAIKADAHTQRFLIEHRGYHRTPYIGQHGWTSVARLPPADWDEVERLVHDGYRLAAPASLVRALDE